jgi:hypothetical protein
MSGVSLTVDHDAAMWCNQVRGPALPLCSARTRCDPLALQLVLRLRSLLFHSLSDATGGNGS